MPKHFTLDKTSIYIETFWAPLKSPKKSPKNWDIWTKQLLPHARKSRPNGDKSPNLVTLDERNT